VDSAVLTRPEKKKHSSKARCPVNRDEKDRGHLELQLQREVESF